MLLLLLLLLLLLWLAFRLWLFEKLPVLILVWIGQMVGVVVVELVLVRSMPVQHSTLARDSNHQPQQWRGCHRRSEGTTATARA
jgi:hypothetical protein